MGRTGEAGQSKVEAFALSPGLLRTFGRSYDPPYWIIETLWRKGPFAVRSDLEAAIEAVPYAAICAMESDARIQAEHMFPAPDPDTQARLFLLSRYVAQELERTRLSEIAGPGPQATLH